MTKKNTRVIKGTDPICTRSDKIDGVHHFVEKRNHKIKKGTKCPCLTIKRENKSSVEKIKNAAQHTVGFTKVNHVKCISLYRLQHQG